MPIELCGMISLAKRVPLSTGPAEATRHSKGFSMKRFILTVVTACMILLNVSALCQTVPDKEIASRIQAYLQPFGETGNLIGSVLVARGGRILFRQSYGMANYELRVPNSNETRYHIASVSKPFTAAAILQLQEQNRLSV